MEKVIEINSICASPEAQKYLRLLLGSINTNPETYPFPFGDPIPVKSRKSPKLARIRQLLLQML